MGVGVSSGQLDLFRGYGQALRNGNRRLNLTSPHAEEEAEVTHFLDSATTLPLLPQPLPDGYAVLDVGTGAGFPGLPLRILRPGLRLTLLEATERKVRFLEELLRLLGLEDVEIVHDRAETAAHAPAWRERFHLVLARAVAPLPTLAELCLPFCRLGGRFVAYKKGDIQGELAAAGPALELLGGRLERAELVRLSAFPDRRVLVVIAKVGPTPPGYPRRPGIPAKRPLGRERAGR